MYKKVQKASQILLAIIGVLTPILIGVIFVSDTFATNAAEEDREVRMQKYIDQKLDRQQAEFTEMKNMLIRIDERVYDLHRERAENGRKRRR